MSSNKIYPAGIPYRQPRPRNENGLAGIILGALLGGALTENPIGAITGGAIGNALINKPLPLEAAIRAHFTKLGLPVIGFYRLGPRMAKVLFHYHDQFWTVTSSAPDSPDWKLDDLDDWLYGDIIENQLPPKLDEINTHLSK